MKQVFTLFCFAAASSVAMAQNLLIYTDGSKVPQTIALSSIDSIVVQQQTGHPEMTELVDVQIKNLGRFSFDVEVKKGDDCVKYVIGAMLSEMYNEERFVEAAQQTLDEDAFYRQYIDGIATTDKVFAERDLDLRAVVNYDNEAKVSVKTTVAVYAIDASGNYKVYTQEFQVPSAKCALSPTATLEVTDIATDNFNITINASDDCKKLIYGITSKEALNGGAMSADAMVADKMSQGLPLPYTGTVNVNSKSINQAMQSGSVYYPYVIPIAADGTIGQVIYKTITTKAYASDGAGRILSATGTLQVEGQYRSIACPKMTFNDEAQKVRIMWCSETDYNNYKGRIVEVFGKETYKNRAWYEYDVDALPRAFSVYHYGAKYYMFAVTVDKDGNVSEAQDVLALMGAGSPYTVHSESSVAPDIDFNGTADVVVANPEHEVRYSIIDPTKVIESNPYFTVQPGENLSRVLIMRIGSGAVENAVEVELAGYPNYLVGDNGVQCELTWTGTSWVIDPDNSLTDCTNEGNTIRFKETFLGDSNLVFVTIDSNERPKIAYVYKTAKQTLEAYK